MDVHEKELIELCIVWFEECIASGNETGFMQMDPEERLDMIVSDVINMRDRLRGE